MMIQIKSGITISELSKRADLPISTIKFYIRKKLLPEPVRTGQTRAFYTSKHLNRIKLIQKIKKEGKISLDKIKEIIKLIDRENDMVVSYSLKTPLQQKSQMIEAAIDVFREKGYDTASVSEITKVVGIGRSSFYKHFKNKKDIFLACIQCILEESPEFDISEGDDEKDIIDVINKHVEALTEASPLWRDTVNMLRAAAVSNPADFAGKLEEVMHRKIDIYTKRAHKAVQNGLLRDIDPRVFAVMTLGIQEYCHEYLGNGQKEDIKRDILEKVKDITFHGVLKK